GPNKFLNLFNGFVRSNKFFLGRRIYPVETRRNRWRTGDAHMHLFRPGLTDHTDDFLAGRPPHNRVVDQHHPFTFKQTSHRIQLELHAKIAHRLTWLNEGSSHIVIANESEAQRNPAFGGISHRSGNTGIRYGHHYVSLHRRLLRELPPKVFAALLHWTSKDTAVGARKIDVLENTARLRQRSRIEPRGCSFRPS